MNRVRNFGFSVVTVLAVCVLFVVACGDTEGGPDASGSDISVMDSSVETRQGDEVSDLQAHEAAEENDVHDFDIVDTVDGIAVPDRELTMLPFPADFGQVRAGQSADMDVVITNSGAMDFQVLDVYLDYEGSTGFSIVTFSSSNDIAAFAELAAGESVTVTIRYAPQGIGVDSTRIHIGGTFDGQSASFEFDVFGTGIGPQIELVPTTLDFGFAAQNVPRLVTLTIKNNGTTDLTIQGLEITEVSDAEYGQPFAITYNPEVTVTSPTDPQPTVIPAGGFVPFELSYINAGPEGGDVTATLVITSDDPVEPELHVPMLARPIVGPRCRAQLVPALLNFGVVAVGFSKTVEARLVNTGTGACTVTGWHIGDCSADVEGGWVCPDPMQGDDSQYFDVVDGPSTAAGALGAGQQVSMQIRYTPPEAGVDQQVGLSALLSIRLRDDTDSTIFLIPDCSGPCTPNVSGGTDTSGD